MRRDTSELESFSDDAIRATRTGAGGDGPGCGTKIIIEMLVRNLQLESLDLSENII